MVVHVGSVASGVVRFVSAGHLLTQRVVVAGGSYQAGYDGRGCSLSRAPLAPRTPQTEEETGAFVDMLPENKCAAKARDTCRGAARFIMYRRNISGESGWWGWGGASPGVAAPAAGHLLDIPAAAAAQSSGEDLEEEEEEEGEGSAPTTWENIVTHWQRGETDAIRRVESAATAEEAAGAAAGGEGAAAVAEEAGQGSRSATLPHHASVRSTTEGSGDVVVQVEGGGVAVPPGVEPQRREIAAAVGVRAGAGGGVSAGAGGGGSRGAAAAHAAPAAHAAAPDTAAADSSGGIELGKIVVESNNKSNAAATSVSAAAPPSAAAAAAAAAATTTVKADADDGERYCRICLAGAYTRPLLSSTLAFLVTRIH